MIAAWQAHQTSKHGKRQQRSTGTGTSLLLGAWIAALWALTSLTASRVSDHSRRKRRTASARQNGVANAPQRAHESQAVGERRHRDVAQVGSPGSDGVAPLAAIAAAARATGSSPKGTWSLLGAALPLTPTCSAATHPQDEMLGSVRDQAGGAWCVLVMDPVTTKVLSNVAGVSDVMDYGVSREWLDPILRCCTCHLGCACCAGIFSVRAFKLPNAVRPYCNACSAAYIRCHVLLQWWKTSTSGVSRCHS